MAYRLDDLMVDNGEDVRYNLIMIFEAARWDAEDKAYEAAQFNLILDSPELAEFIQD